MANVNTIHVTISLVLTDRSAAMANAIARPAYQNPRPKKIPQMAKQKLHPCLSMVAKYPIKPAPHKPMLISTQPKTVPL
jgi:hypothetical protein